MKIYKLDTDCGVFVDGDFVQLKGCEIDALPKGFECINYTDPDAFPFKYDCVDKILSVGRRGGTHEDIPDTRNKTQEGRVWQDSKILTSWFPLSPDDMKNIIEQFPFDISDFNYLEFCERDDANYLVAFKCSEYNVSPESFFSNIENQYKKQNRASAEMGDKTINGMSSKDFWRHHAVVGENKIAISGEDINEMVRECLYRIKNGITLSEDRKPKLLKTDGHIPSVLYHVSNPKFRAKIMKQGLRPMVGDSYRAHFDDTDNLTPVVFLKDKNDYDSTYNDDRWAVDTSTLDKSSIFADFDEYMANQGCYVYTKTIAPESLTLLHKGDGQSID